MKGLKSHHRIGDFLDETVILFNQVIQIVNLEYFNKADQACKHQQEIHIFQPDIVCASFFHNGFKVTIRDTLPDVEKKQRTLKILETEQ